MWLATQWEGAAAQGGGRRAAAQGGGGGLMTPPLSHLSHTAPKVPMLEPAHWRFGVPV